MNEMQKTRPHYTVKPAILILGVSHWLAALFACMGLVAGLAVVILPWNWWVKTLLLCVIMIATAYHLWRDVWHRHPRSPVMLELNHVGELWVTLRNGTRQQASVHGSSLVTANFTVLNLQLDKRVPCLILPDAVDAQAFRRLRIWLRWGIRE